MIYYPPVVFCKLCTLTFPWVCGEECVSVSSTDECGWSWGAWLAFFFLLLLPPKEKTNSNSKGRVKGMPPCRDKDNEAELMYTSRRMCCDPVKNLSLCVTLTTPIVVYKGQVSKLPTNKCLLCFFFSSAEWNRTQRPEAGEYFTGWQWQCEGTHWYTNALGLSVVMYCLQCHGAKHFFFIVYS